MNSSRSETDVDIIIIGAGISGMAAAFHILEHDPAINILVLEANSRIGGSVLSIPLKTSENQIRTFDVGGQFISRWQIHIIDLVKKLNLHLVRMDRTGGKTIWNLESDSIIKCESILNLKQHNRNELVNFFTMVYKMSQNFTFVNSTDTRENEKLDGKTMEDFIVENLQTTFSQNLIRHIIRMSCEEFQNVDSFLGVEPSEITVFFYLVFCNSTKEVENKFLTEACGSNELWIQGGADQICQQIATIIGRNYIKKNDSVIEISQTANQVLVETENNTYVGKFAIIAIPPKDILDIDFNPSLTESRRTLLHSMQAGCFIKFVVTYKTQFWKQRGCNGNIISCGKSCGMGPIQACYNISWNNKPALTGYLLNNNSSLRQEKSLKTQVLNNLAKYFGDSALDPIDYYEQDWSKVPYHQNCTTYSLGLDNMDNFSEIRLPMGRLFWAGTQTANNWNGYMNGAVQAGFRAAIEVLYEDRPQTLTTVAITYVTCSEIPGEGDPQIPPVVSRRTSKWTLILPLFGLIAALYYFKKRHN